MTSGRVWGRDEEVRWRGHGEVRGGGRGTGWLVEGGRNQHQLSQTNFALKNFELCVQYSVIVAPEPRDTDSGTIAVVVLIVVVLVMMVVVIFFIVEAMIVVIRIIVRLNMIAACG